MVVAVEAIRRMIVEQREALQQTVRWSDELSTRLSSIDLVADERAFIRGFIEKHQLRDDASVALSGAEGTTQGLSPIPSYEQLAASMVRGE